MIWTKGEVGWAPALMALGFLTVHTIWPSAPCSGPPLWWAAPVDKISLSFLTWFCQGFDLSSESGNSVPHQREQSRNWLNAHSFRTPASNSAWDDWIWIHHVGWNRCLPLIALASAESVSLTFCCRLVPAIILPDLASPIRCGKLGRWKLFARKWSPVLFYQEAWLLVSSEKYWLALSVHLANQKGKYEDPSYAGITLYISIMLINWKATHWFSLSSSKNQISMNGPG